MYNKKQTYNPCDDCQYSYSKNNQESEMCKICEFRYFLDKSVSFDGEMFGVDGEIFSIISNAINGANFDDINDAACWIERAGYRKQRAGEWIDRDGKTWCSLCQASNKQYKPPFCPHCGAKMNGGKT